MNKYKEQKLILDQQKNISLAKIHKDAGDKENKVYDEYKNAVTLLQRECTHNNRKKVVDFDYHHNEETITTFCEDCGARLKRVYG